MYQQLLCTTQTICSLCQLHMTKRYDILGFYYNTDSYTELSYTQAILDHNILIQICFLITQPFSSISSIKLFVIYLSPNSLHGVGLFLKR